MLKSKIPLGCLIQSKVNIEAFYSNYGLTPPMWVPANTWLRVGSIDVTPVRGSRHYVCVDFFIEGVKLPQRAAIHYDEIAEVWNDGPRFLTTIPHYWSERELLGLIPEENQEKLTALKTEHATLKRFDDAEFCGYLIGRL